jgi:hypothetical protein
LFIVFVYMYKSKTELYTKLHTRGKKEQSIIFFKNKNIIGEIRLLLSNHNYGNYYEKSMPKGVIQRNHCRVYNCLSL